MATYNRTIKLIATKLGLGEEEKLLNKAAEFERLLQTKSITGSSISDTSKVVICLDLAASIFGADLDNKAAIKYSGLRGPSYASCRKVVENLLEINHDNLTVQFLCVSLQCTSVQLLAEKILEEYKRQAKTDVDLNLPQYVCMAVYHACRLNKVKVPKSKLIEKSRLKPAQWAKLDADWTKIVDEKFSNVTIKKKGRPLKKSDKNDDEKQMQVETKVLKEKPTEPEIEPYEDWKKRMLETAYKELKELETKQRETEDKERLRRVKEMTSPRRSPRKTPQKFSPYKSPAKSVNGIRLLFPRE